MEDNLNYTFCITALKAWLAIQPDWLVGQDWDTGRIFGLVRKHTPRGERTGRRVVRKLHECVST